MTMKLMLLLGLGYTTSACGGPQLASAHASAPMRPEVAPEPGRSADSRAVQEDAVDPAAAIIALCAAVQQSARLPVACQVDMVEGIARMQLVMSDRAAFESFGASAIEELAAPFCTVANAAEQPAGVVVSVHSERVQRTISCIDGRMTEWESADPVTRQLTGAARACQAIEASRYPVHCAMGAVDDVPSLVVRYNARGVSSSDLQTLEQLVARPFCEAVVAAGSEAFVYLVEDEKRARGWSCASQADTGWHDISPEPPKPRSTPRPNRGTAAADSREQFAALPYRYRRLPVASNRP